MSESDTRFLDPLKEGAGAGGQESHLDLSAVEGSFAAEPAEGGGPKLVSRSWETARLTVELATGVRARSLDVTMTVNGREFPAQVVGEGGGRVVVEAEFSPSSVPSGTHTVQVHVEDSRGESATVDVGQVQVFGMMGAEDATLTPASSTTTTTATTTASATAGSTDSTILGLPREQAVVGGVGAGVLAVVFGSLLL